jgi:hypothetical protein
MTSAQLFRISGLALWAGAVAFIVHIVARSVITAGQDPAVFAREGLWAPVNALGVLGAALVLLGLPATYARMAGNLIAPTGPTANLAVNLLSNLGPVLLLVALGSLGFRLWSEHAPATQAEPGAD